MNRIATPLMVAALIGCVSFADSAEETFTEYQVGENESLRYRILDPVAAPSVEGYRLVVFLPGGDGSEVFTRWCQSIYENALPENVLAVQLIAPKWEAAQQTVWPTEYTPEPEMDEPVEDFFEAVVEAVGKSYPLAEGEVYTFSWSSGGVAAYVIAAEGRASIRGSFVAMAAFREGWLPRSLRKVEGQRFFLYQSPEDTVTPLAFAEDAEVALTEAGGSAKLETYAGGHGWPLGAGHFPAIREAFEWLFQE